MIALLWKSFNPTKLEKQIMMLVFLLSLVISGKSQGTGCTSSLVLDCMGRSSFCQGGDCILCSTTWNNCSLCSNSECLYCNSGHVLVNNKCQPCSESFNNTCLLCTSEKCLRCSEGSVVVNNDCYQCEDFVPNCVKCKTTSGIVRCEDCSKGHYLTPNFGCNPCSSKFQKCEECSNTTCFSCQSGYLLVSNECKLCSEEKPNCAECEEQRCSKCGQGYFLTSLGVCKSCETTFAGCAVCDNTECKTCYSKNKTLSVHQGMCVSCSKKWEKCTTCNDFKCLSCEDNQGVFYNNGLCERCLPNCKRCGTTTNCIECDEGFYLENSQCLSCQKRGCRTCSGSQCFTCLQNYFFKRDGSCEQCSIAIPHCKVCGETNEKKCLLCEKGYTSNGNTCTSCNSNCGDEGCVGTRCINCKEGLVFDKTKQNCVDKSESCDEVRNSLCVRCKSNFTLINNICIESTKATNGRCKSDQYLLYNGTDCILGGQIADCQFNSGVCSTCNGGTFKNEAGVCVDCAHLDEKCSFCSPFGNGQYSCQACFDGYYPDKMGCKKCSTLTGCLSCFNIVPAGYDTINYCFGCEKGYYLNGTQCVKIPNCAIANNSGCVQCEQNYIMNNKNECVSASSHTGCAGSSDNECNSCESGFYLNSESVCKLCSIPYCKNCRSENLCVQCNSNYSLVRETECSPCVLEGCNLCDSSNNLCLGCNDFYFLDGSGVCKKCDTNISHCVKCSSSNQCVKCESDHFLEGGVCKSCSEIEGCLSCLSTQKVCTKCDGYTFLENSKCSKCSSRIPNCKKCAASGECLECFNSTFYLTNGECKSCSLKSGCSLCDPSRDQCILCGVKNKLVSTGGVSECKSCQQIDSNCEICENDGSCSSCKNGRTLNGSGICVYCSDIPNCVGCSTKSYKCNNCENGFGLFNDTTCQECTELTKGNCSSCSNSNYCSSCNDKFYLKDNKCLSCNEISGCESCDKNNGNCVVCKSGWFLDNGNCVDCEVIEGCSKCSTIAKECEVCNIGYYLESTNHTCIKCSQLNPNCIECKKTVCTLCKDNHYPQSSNCLECSNIKDCEQCEQNKMNCTKCKTGGVNSFGTCSVCEVKYCSECSTSSICDKCLVGYYKENNECSLCSNIPNCKECNPEQKECNVCDPAYYVENKICVSCNHDNNHCAECTTSTNCLKCENGDYTILNSVCVLCKNVFDNCLKCDPSGGSCKKCDVGYYFNTTNMKCTKCSENISKCVECSIVSDSLHCDACEGNGYYSKKHVCVKVGFHLYKTSETTVSYCSQALSNCLGCKYVNEVTLDKNYLVCGLCQEGYGLNDSNLCIPCDNGINISNGKCEICAINCDKCINGLCLRCKEGYALRNYTCYEIKNKEECSIPLAEGVGCECCKNGITTSGSCPSSKRNEECSFYTTSLTTEQCGTYYPQTKSIRIKEEGICENKKQGRCVKCESGYFLGYSNPPECSGCGICKKCNKNDSCLICNQQYNQLNGSCIDFSSNCKTTSTDFCLSCSSKYSVKNGDCNPCKSGCSFCYSNGECLKCDYGFVLVDDNCVKKEESFCQEIDKTTSRCIECQMGYYLGSSGNCLQILLLNDCDYISNGACLECSNNTKYDIDIYGRHGCKTDAAIQNCDVLATTGCISCIDGYYLKGLKCEKCSLKCGKCYNLDTCLTCPFGSFLNERNGECESVGELINKCKIFLPSGECAICKDGYYWTEKNCIGCKEYCERCKTNETCLSCNYTKGYIERNTLHGIECIHKSEFYLCQNFSRYGCNRCQAGYYLDSGNCSSCSNNCTVCTSFNMCYSCELDYVLVNAKCIHYSLVARCTGSENSRCSGCSERNYKVSSDGSECLYHTNLFLAVGIPLILVFILIVVIMMGTFLIFLWLRKRKQQKIKEETICEFDMKKSNISFTMLNEDCGLVINKKEVDFLIDYEEDNPFLPVGKESRDLLCIGNKKSKMLKVQLSTKDQLDKYEIRINPQLITLKKGKAVEFEIFIKPLCTCTLNEPIMLVALDMHKGKQFDVSLKMRVKTEITTHLDYDELKEEKKIGEGSFGVVFKGTFRDKVVAIKKMKESASTKAKMEEFNKEVAMLDKFRSDYLVHFYGAVFIPNRICMVNEFCPHGSIQDLMKKHDINFVSERVRVKFMIDAAKGIEYLHSNGIMHRDIKPDNFLVISVVEDVSVNCKLTDFGASRNVNQMMTNMTFTKGIGTPKYMSPEVLDKKHYKYPADIYSFAITMFEIMKWGDAYDKNEFQYPWSIADFVINGKRLENDIQMDSTIFGIICNCWTPYSAKRWPIEKVIEGLTKWYYPN